MWRITIQVKLFIISSILVSLSNYSYADVYKCRNADGHVTYQSAKCASDEISSKVKIVQDKVKRKKIVRKTIKNEPSGAWVGVNNSQLKANVADYGGFEMTDIKGMLLKGTWQTADNNGYTVSARFKGVRFPVNMKYDVAKDSLFLSKPGLPNSFEMYRRR